MTDRGGGLRLVDGRIWIRPSRRLLWWRPFARLEAEGLVLVPRRGPEQLLPWAAEWSFYFSEGFHSPSQLVVTVDGRSSTLSGWYWGELPARPITALIEFLRSHLDSAAGLSDPAVAARLETELAACRPSWKGRPGLRWLLGGFLDERVEDELARWGVVSVEEVVVRTETTVDTREIARTIVSSMPPIYAGKVSVDEVDARVHWYLREPHWPFDVLTPEPR